MHRHYNRHQNSEVSRISISVLTLVTGHAPLLCDGVPEGRDRRPNGVAGFTYENAGTGEDCDAAAIPIVPSIAGRSMVSADQSNENTVVATQLPIAGNWHLFEWIWGVSFFLSIMLAMAGWLYVLGTLSIKVVYWLAS